LEAMGRENRIAAAPALLPELEREFARVESALGREKTARL
jgi:hypothetical protein